MGRGANEEGGLKMDDGGGWPGSVYFNFLSGLV